MIKLCALSRKAFKMNKDLTVGEPSKVLWAFCLPLFGSIIFQQMYNIADSLVVGKFVGENALAAVGNSYEITLIYIAVATGCNIGCSVVVSHFFGAKEYSTMRTAVTTSWIASGAMCLALVLIGFIFGGALLQAINTPTEVFADSKLYLDIYIWGLPFVFFYNLATGIFSALGDSKTPFIFLAISSVANVVVDIIFVKSFGWGVAGAAWATFMCQGISCILAVVVVNRRLRAFKEARGAAIFNMRILKRFLVIAVPSILQTSSVSIGNIIIQSVINSFGTGVMAGYAASIKLNNLFITSITTVSNGISNYAAQNIGAGKYSRVKEGFNASIKILWTIALPMCLLYFFLGRYLILFFMDSPTETAISTGVTFLHIVAPFYFVVAAKMASDGILKGATRMNEFLVATFSDLVIRVAGAIFFSMTILGATGIWCAWPIGWIVGTLLSIWFYKKTLVRISAGKV